jgi:hypothetical protein
LTAATTRAPEPSPRATAAIGVIPLSLMDVWGV